MLEVKSCITPSAEQWQAVIQGMRLPMKSLDRYDSGICDNSEEYDPLCDTCPEVVAWKGEKPYCTPICYYDTFEDGDLFVLGEKDKRLALGLCKAGDPSHRKFLRQLPITLTVRAPLYWWKQADQYRINATTNSESTMHCLTKYPFKLEDFSVEHYKSIFGSKTEDQLRAFEDLLVSDLNDLRDRYLETKDMKYWYALEEILPQSYMQTRCWSINYETALNIINQRRGHKNKEWDMLIDYLLENVPYLNDFYEASQARNKAYKELKEENKELKRQVEVLELTCSRYMQ